MKDEEKEINEVFHAYSKRGKYQELVKKYPDVFKQMESSLPMPYYLFGFEIEEGWYDIIEKLAAKINFELQGDKKLNNMFYITQIKEKWGSLVVDVSGATEPIHDAIEEAEKDSSTTCELCGEPGKLRNNGWYSVRCDKCWEKENE